MNLYPVEGEMVVYPLECKTEGRDSSISGYLLASLHNPPVLFFFLRRLSAI